MRVSKRKSLRIAGRMNPVSFLNLTCIAAAGLNHPVEPPGFSAIAVMVSWSMNRLES